MPRPGFRCVAFWLLAISAGGGGSRLTAAPPDKPVPAKEAAARMTVPEGFRVSLFAGEPDIVQPIAMTFDDRGRLWVVECLSYPKWSQDGKGGKDRVVILEDTDGDGTFDKKTVFLDNGVNLSGIELGFGGVWLCSSPNLVFVPDRDGDGKPDGPPEVLLDGWNIKDAKHNVFNSLGWGPDGWLYGCNGIQTKSRVGRPGTPDTDRVYLDCGVWRYHPTKKTFEVYATGTTNPFGLDWDEHGEMFITNCVIDHLWHFVPGGHYQRMYGQDANPYLYDAMKSPCDHRHWAGGDWTNSRGSNAGVKAEHSDAGGGHAHSGLAIYLGENFPPEYRGSAFMCNIHGNRLNRDTLHRRGSGNAAKHGKDFLFANDPWFRGICTKVGPDGGLYVSDWTDTGECHNYQTVDATNGRIYKVTYGKPKAWTGDVSKMTDKELWEAHASKNEWLVRKARRCLQERRASGTHDLAAMASSCGKTLPCYRTLHAMGLFDPEGYAKGITPRSGEFAPFSIRFGSEAVPNEPKFVQAVCEAGASGDPGLRMGIASAIQRMTDGNKLAVARAVLTHPEDNADHNLSLMYWYAVQPAVLTLPGQALALAGTTKIDRVRTNIIRLHLTKPGVDLPAALAEVVAVLAATTDDTFRRGLIDGIRLAIAGRRDVTPPAGWAETSAALLGSPDPGVRTDAEALAVDFGDPMALAALRARITNATVPADDRRAAVERLSARKVPNFGPVLRGLLAEPAVRAAAVRALAAYPDADTPAAILRAYPAFTAGEKADAVQTLAGRPAFALALLDAVAKGAVPRTDVSAFTARQLLALNNKEVAAKLATAWGTVRPASETRAAQATKFKALLTPETLKTADAGRGRAVFAKTCANCHKLFGDGGDVGPELTGSQRANLDYVLENVLDPSAVVPGEYRMTAFALADGRTLTGIVRKETPQAVTVRTLNEEVTVPKADIDGRKQTPLSIMPDGLFDALKDDEVRDLVAYLASPRQVPVP